MALLLPAPVGAHVVLGRLGLRRAVEQAEVVVLAEFESGVELWQAPDGSDRQDRYRVRRLETLKGAAPPEQFEFFPHAEGLPAFAQGDHALLFLEHTAEHTGFGSVAARFPYFSIQGAGDEWIVSGDPGSEAILVMARRIAALPGEPGERRNAALRQVALDSLQSGVPKLRADALNELVQSRSAGLFATPDETAPFAALTFDPDLTVPERLLLLRALSDAPGFSESQAWDALLTEELEKDELRAVLRAAGASDEARLSDFVASRLADEDPDIRREAVRALTHPRHAAQHEGLTRVARESDDATARSAIHALGALRSPEARADLEALAVELDPPRRRWAEAELRRR